ncbi:PQQ-dependent sugar dehydrogenase [Litoreibacter roseus]|nr:PQQ-dependent sugar dehydrogenase [Litoreibacter roseus]
MHRSIHVALLLSTLATPLWALETSQGTVTVTEIASGFDQPWGVDFIPDGGILITERGGQLIHLQSDGSRIDVSGVPEVVGQGQGGLLDIMVASDFAQSREVFLSYSKPQPKGSGTALAKARLSEAGDALEGLEVIFEQAEGYSSGRHFGSRIVEGADGTLFLTIGERGDRPSAQNIANHNGTVVRVTRDGTVPADNPFVQTEGARPEIWSYGHRNPQGAALDLDGNLWVAEHGAQGGDEINRVRAGANYGWPVISYGRHYSGAKIGEGTSKDGMEQPTHYWDPSIAPSGMMIYSGKLWPEWEGDAFVGSLKFNYISRVSGTNLSEEAEQIRSDETARVRDVVEGPDGGIWFLSVMSGGLYRITP